MKETSKVGLQYSRGDGATEPQLVEMCDASYACHGVATSQGGFFFSMCGAAVSWKSNKIRKVMLSSTEAEYVVCSDTSRVAEGHRNFLCDLGLLPEDQDVTIRTDSRGAEALVANPVQRQRTRHKATPHYYVRQFAEVGVVVFNRESSAENAADVLTKGATRPFHSFACGAMGLSCRDSKVYMADKTCRINT